MQRSCGSKTGGFLPAALNLDPYNDNAIGGATAVDNSQSNDEECDDGFELFFEDEDEVVDNGNVPLNADETPTTTTTPTTTAEATAQQALSTQHGVASTSDLQEVIPPLAFVDTSSSPSSLNKSSKTKSALKRVSSYGCLELTGEDIPICSKRSSWKTLPVPSKTNMRRTESTASFFHHDDYTETTTTEANSSIKRNVSFAKIHVRNYDLTVGDNPACHYGTPVSLDWQYTEHEPLELDRYEECRPTRRNARQMHLNCYQRQHILALHNVPVEEMKAAKKQVKRIQRQRAVTSYFAPVMKLEDAAESAARKVKRLVSGNKLQRSKTTGSISRSKSLGWLHEDDTIQSSGAYSVQTI